MSLWQWIPIRAELSEITFETTSDSSSGSIPPLVSQRAITSAPASAATLTTSSAYAGFARYPSKKCSASRNTLWPPCLKKLIESLIIAKFSCKSVFRASSTWRSCDFATRVTTGAPDSASALRSTSSAALLLARLVAPKATNVAFFSFNSLAANLKNSVSFGLAPGHPPSMKPTPRSSRCLAIVNLS